MFNGNHATKNVSAFGHIDRDDWSDAFLQRSPHVRPLPVNEVEGIVCFEPVFKALAAYYGKPDVGQLYLNFMTDARNAVQGTILNKHALNRAKLVLEQKQQEMRNAVKSNPDIGILKNAFLAGVATPTEAESIFDEQVTFLNAALPTEGLMQVFPAKTYQAGFQRQIGVTTETALDEICAVLAKPDAELHNEQSKATLKAAVIAALSPHLFDRLV